MNAAWRARRRAITNGTGGCVLSGCLERGAGFDDPERSFAGRQANHRHRAAMADSRWFDDATGTGVGSRGEH